MRLRDLFGGKPGLQAADPALRLAALTSVEDAAALAELARTDPAGEVRRGALERLRDPALLVALAREAGEVGLDATARLTDLLQASPELAVEGLADEPLLLAIALRTSNIDLACRLMRLLPGESSHLTLAIEGRNPAIRQEAAASIRTREGLQELRNRARGRDKLAYTAARDRLRALDEEQAERQRLLGAARQLAEQLARLASNTADPLFERSARHLQDRWAALWQSMRDPAITAEFADIEADYRSALQRCEAEIERRRAAAAEHRQAEASRAEILRELDQLLAVLETGRFDGHDLHQRRQQLGRRWLAVPGAKSPAESEHYHTRQARVDAILDAHERWRKLRAQLDAPAEPRRLRQLLEQVEQFIWPAQPAEDHAPQLERLRLLHQQHNEQEQAEQQARREERRLLDELEAAINDGKIRPARQLHQRIETRLKAEARAAATQDRFQGLTKRLSELGDWQRFATRPKREELCRQAESLIDADLPPQVLAERIADLHETWKGLGDSRQDQKLWHRFQRASNKAYEPCRQFFEQQKQQREEHQELCQQMCSDLELYEAQYDWNQPDWKLVAQTIATARREWRELGTRNRANQRRLQSRFDRVLARLDARVDGEHQRVAAARQQLIEELRQTLAAATDDKAAVALAKRLQTRWRECGSGRRDEDQRQWKEFRALCDEAFQRQDRAREQSRQQTRDLLQQAQAACEDIARVAAAGEELSISRLNALRERVLAVPLAAGERAAIDKRLQQVTADYRRALRQREQDSQRQELLDLRERAELCQRLEALAGTAADPSAIEALWAAAPALPRELATAIDARFQRALAGLANPPDGDQLAANAEQARRLCVRLEMLRGIDSPAADQTLRLQLQVDRLNREWAGGQKPAPEQQTRQLVIEWYSLGPLAEADRARLRGRFDLAAQPEFE